MSSETSVPEALARPFPRGGRRQWATLGARWGGKAGATSTPMSGHWCPRGPTYGVVFNTAAATPTWLVAASGGPGSS